VSVARTLGLEVAGVDILFDGDGYSVCEANSSPGFTGLEQATGVDVPDVIFSNLLKSMGRVATKTSWARAALAGLAPMVRRRPRD
jgi:glutathione synthase/RimK-type ligase-like ATP-grasp enzyme